MMAASGVPPGTPAPGAGPCIAQAPRKDFCRPDPAGLRPVLLSDILNTPSKVVEADYVPSSPLTGTGAARPLNNTAGNKRPRTTSQQSDDIIPLRTVQPQNDQAFSQATCQAKVASILQKKRFFFETKHSLL